MSTLEEGSGTSWAAQTRATTVTKRLGSQEEPRAAAERAGRLNLSPVSGREAEDTEKKSSRTWGQRKLRSDPEVTMVS